MADEIDRSVEPELGADDSKGNAKKSEALPSGVRVRSRSKKDAKATKKVVASPQKASIKSTGKKVVNKTVESVPELKETDTSELEMKLEGIGSKISNLSDELVNTARAMEQSGSKLLEQEDKLFETVDDFKNYKHEQQKISAAVLLSSFFAVVISVGFLVYAVFNFSSKNDFFDSASSALTIRIADMESGLSSFEAARAQLSLLQEQIEGLEISIEESQLSYDATEQDIQGQLLGYSEDMSQELTEQAANLRENLARLDDRFSIFNSQILDFGDVLEQSENVIAEIGTEARSLNELRQVMDALLTLEREKYYQALNGSAGQNGQVGTNVDEPSDNDMPTFNRYYNR